MSHNKVYRNFIILQGDENEHTSSDDKVLSGYAKLEEKGDKCKISFYAQNLKKDENYSVVLICYKKDMKQIVDLGSLMVKEEGKAEVCKEYYIKNIAGLDLSCDKVSGAAICKVEDNDKLRFIMYGFANGEKVNKDWKKLNVVKQVCDSELDKDSRVIEKKIEKPIKPQTKEKTKEKEKRQERVEEKVQEEKEEKEEKETVVEVKEAEPQVEEISENREVKEEKVEIQHSSRNDDHEFKGVCNNFDEYESRIEQEKSIDPFDFKMRGSIGEFFEDLAKGFEEVKNKFKDIKFCKWYKVEVNDIDTLCDASNYNKYTLVYYPMLNYYPYIKKYGYFFLGYKCDKSGELKYIVYGVPGTKDKDEQPYMGKTGFVTWMKTYDEEMGCWLMFYDYKTSNVVVPVN